MKRFEVQRGLMTHQRHEKLTNSKSQTIPGMALSVKELISNHVRGIGLGAIVKKAIYDEEVDPTRSPDFDFADATEYLRQTDFYNALNEQVVKQAPKVEEVPKEPSETTKPE
nr:MAG: hypothetical protein [Microvirus sp.]